MPRPSPTYAQDPALVALGAAIRRLRKERGISQERLASASSIDRAYMGSVEKGDQNVSFTMVVRVAQTLELTLTELVAEARL